MTVIANFLEEPIKRITLLLFVVIGATCHPVEEAGGFVDPWSSAGLEWTPAFNNLKILESPENSGVPHLRGKRSVDSQTATSNQLPNKSYQACIAPGNRKGHCRHVNRCILDEFRGNFARFMDYFCVIEQTYVGACCPDQAEVSEARTFNLNSMVGALLPVIADENEDRPVWDFVKKPTVPDDDEYGESNVTTAFIDWNNTSEATTQSTRQPRAPRGCGVNSNSPIRVHGGSPSAPQQWPWMVALLRERTSQFCGGVLITDRHVLSAAHCVYRFKASELTVRLGEYDFTVNDETRMADFQVVEIRQHRSFDPSTYVNDIAVLKMHKPTVFNSYIWPICLPPVGLTFENKSAIVAGWGTQWFGGPASTVLMDVAVPVWPQHLCVRSFTQDIPPTAMCAGAYEGGRDSCQGDSGGPLLHQLGNGRWVTIGIVSWGIRCGEPNHPGVYTRVNSYLDWIFANVIF